MREHLKSLLALPENWNSYGAPRIEPNAVAKAVQVMQALQREPHVIPASDGGVQLEWPSVDVEITIAGDGSVVYD